MQIENRPFYHLLYRDMIRDKYPDKEEQCRPYLSKQNWTALDVIQVNELLFGSQKSKADVDMERKHRSYDSESIKQILLYQQGNKLNNNQLSIQYGISRNTIAKWKKLFVEELGD